MLACIGFFAASCSDDDNPDPGPATDYAKEIASTYVGDLSVELPAGEGGLIEDKSSINIVAATTPNKVDLVLENFVINIGGTPLNVGTIKLTDVEVEGKNGVVNIKEKEFKDYELENLPIKATIVVKSGTVKGEELTNLVLHINNVFSSSIIVKFAGVKNNKKGEALITEVKVEKHDAIEGDATLDAKANLITVELKEGATLADLKEVIFTFKTSDKAIAAPASGSKIDLTSGAAEIKVVAENGFNATTYKVVAKVYKYTFKYDMEEWVFEVEDAGLMAPAGGWGTTNSGTTLLTIFGLVDSPTNVDKTEDAANGTSAVKLATVDSKGLAALKIPKVTSGSLFLGTFETDMDNTLNSTKFGIPFTKKPLTVSGHYKYTPGKVFYRSSVAAPAEYKEEENTVDKCAFNVFLYEIKDDKDAYITGYKTYEDTRIIAHASFESDGAKEYTAFNLELKYTKEYDKSKKYRFAIVASTSSQGDTFSGAPGSTLYLDDIEVIAE